LYGYSPVIYGTFPSDIYQQLTPLKGGYLSITM